MTLLEHIESYLGQTEGGWRDPPGEQWPFYVLQFNNGPISKATVFSTLGLSEFELASPVAGRTIRHELIFMAQSGFGYRNIPAILHDVGTEAISRGRAYLCGEVIGPRGKLFPDSQLEALFLYMPVYLPKEFASYKSPDGQTHGFAWLVPITLQEADFVNEMGWQSFAALLEEKDPDLLDLRRTSVIS